MKALIALDGSSSSMHTLEGALTLLTGLTPKPDVELVFVREPLAARGMLDTIAIALEALEKQSHEQAAQILQPFVDRLTGSGFNYTTHILTGDPSATICEHAQSGGCALIMMGTRGHGAFTGWLVGSVAAKVLHRSTIPVLLIPAPKAANEDKYVGFSFPN